LGFFVITILFLSASYRDVIAKFSGPYSALVYGIIFILTEFGAELYGWAQNKLLESSRERNLKNTLGQFRKFVEKYFGIRIELHDYVYTEIPLIFSLDRAIESIPENSLGNTKTHTRRLKIIPLIFLLKYREIPELLCGEDVIVIAKIRFGNDLGEADKGEFLSAYDHLVMNDKNYQKVSTYFEPLQENFLETTRLHFLDHYMKDDYVKHIATKLKFSEDQSKRFKQSVEAVAKSEKFNIKYLKEFIIKRKKYRKLFLIVCKSGLSKKIQAYIKQNPYFILNYTSIDNLPKIGRSRGLDIFFFSPTRVISNARNLLDELTKIDPGIALHPVKIYEIDPFESVNASLGNDLQLYQSIQYFEHLAFDSSQINELNYTQVLSVLEHSQVSLKDIISELPVAEFYSSVLIDSEKALVNDVYAEFVSKKRTRNIFWIVGNEKRLIKKIRGLSKDDLSHGQDYEAVFPGIKKLSDAKKRLLEISHEINANISALNSSLT
jgi:hypothetical protein